MNNSFFKFAMSTVAYLVGTYSKYLFVSPSNSLIDTTSVIPTLLGLMWGLPAALGCTVGALWDERQDWYIIQTILAEDGFMTAAWESILLLCNCGLWAFIAAYMPWRLGFSLFVDRSIPLFSLRIGSILKFTWIILITYSTQALFLAMTTSESDMLRLLEGQVITLGVATEYALTCFLNVGFAIFFGLFLFFVLLTYEFPFTKPEPVKKYQPNLQYVFDITFAFAIFFALVLCYPRFINFEGLRFFTGILLFAYMFRPLSPLPDNVNEQDKILHRESLKTCRKIVMIFFSFFFGLFLILDWSNIIYGLDNLNTWRQFNAECVSMMDISLVVLICLLLRYRNSIMTNIVMLEVLTVFVSAFVLGGVCILITDRMTTQRDEAAIEEMTIICRERLDRTFNNIKISVTDISDLAVSSIPSYEILRNDEQWRNDFIIRMENISKSIVSNTEGSIAFYLRLSPDIAGPFGGFSYSRDSNSNFVKRTPLDFSRYYPHDLKSVGWYYIPINRHHSTWIEPYIDPLLNTYVISYVQPIYVDNHLVGVVGIDIDFEFLIHEVRRMSVYHFGFVYLLDRFNNILYHKDYPQGSKRILNSELYQESETFLTNGIWLGISVPLINIYEGRNDLLMHLISMMLLITIIVAACSISLASKGIKPLIILTEAAKKIAKGNLSVNLPKIIGTEIGTLVNSIGEMVSKLEIYVYRDKMTGLRNPAAYAKKKEEIASTEKSKLKYSIVVFDVNFLKRTNDTYGHEAGNELIKCAANTIREVFNNSPIYRVGGDEFVAILEGIDYDRREELIAQFDEEIANTHFAVKSKVFDISIARGFSDYCDEKDYDEIFEVADKAMYTHKQNIKRNLGMDINGR